MAEVKIRRIEAETEHDNQKWLILEGSVEGIPAITKRRSINTAALASGDLKLESEIAALKADVLEYSVRYQAVQAALLNL